MAAERYGIKNPTIALYGDGGFDSARTISVGTIVEGCIGPSDENSLVEVACDGRI